MTVKELIKALKNFPDDLEVVSLYHEEKDSSRIHLNTIKLYNDIVIMDYEKDGKVNQDSR
jgi:hypothetical protein